MNRSLLSSAVVLGIVLPISGVARADWPVGRHDSRRTGMSATSSDLSKPAAYWRTYLGGSPGTLQVYASDLDGDGTGDVLVLSGGRVTLYRPDGTAIWHSSGPRIYASIANVVDLDGDGSLDVLVTSRGKVTVLDSKTGTVAWAQPDDVGTLQVVRLGDVDNDGHLDLWVDSCGCCAVENGSVGNVFTFANGVTNATVLLTPPAHPHCDAQVDTLGDWDGDGVQDFLVGGEDKFTLFKGDGTILGTSSAIGAHVSSARCEAVSIDGVPGEEAICFENQYYYTVGERGLFMVTYHPAETPSVKLVWKSQLSPLEGGEARAAGSLFADLDGNGTFEVFASGKTNDTFTTYVFDAASGGQVASVPGVVAGVIPKGTEIGNLLLTTNETQVVAYSFVASPPGLNPVWTISDRTVPMGQDWGLAQTTATAAAPVTTDLNGDGHADLVLLSNSEPRTLSAYDISGAAPSILGTYALDPGVNVAGVGAVQIPSTDRLFVSRNDGYLALLDAKLSPTNLGQQGNEVIPGLRTAGYYINAGVSRGPIAGKLSPGDTMDSLLVVDSRGDLVKIDPTNASNVAPAKPAWRAIDTFGCGIATGSGNIGCFRRRHPVAETPQYVMATLNASGQEVASLPLNRPPTGDVAPGDLLGTGAVAFAAMVVDANLGVDLLAMDAAANQLWLQSYVAGGGVEPLSIADWNGDGIEDVAFVFDAPRVLSGNDGALLQQSTHSVSYFTPIIADLDGDGQQDMTLQAGYQDAHALDHDLATVLWQIGAGDLPFPFGTFTNCGQTNVLIEGSYAKSAQLRFTKANGPNAGETSTVVLASGASYPDEAAAKAANATIGQLGDTAASADLAGIGGDPTVLIGSTDGYLYALDACTATFRWSLDLGGPVGSPILADTDGDGLDEILVSVGDGYLYALKNEVLPSPEFVNDVDPPSGVTDTDVDSIETFDQLYAQWAPVAGATSYEVAIVGGAGTYITSPNWIDVGNVTSATIEPLPLSNGEIYFVGVRAVSAKGRSPDTASDGVVVRGGGGTGGSGGSSSSGRAGAGPGGGGAANVAGGAGGAGDDILVSGRACTCTSPGDDTSALGGTIVGLMLAAAMVCRRRAASTTVGASRRLGATEVPARRS